MERSRTLTKILRGYITMLTFYFAASSSMLQPLTDTTFNRIEMSLLTITPDTKLIRVRQWLSTPDPSVNFQKALHLSQADTGLWLLESDLYRKWEIEASFIWLHGIPGCGKTVLSSTLLENLLQHSADKPGKAVAYFYFYFNDRQKQDPELMVRSLIFQLLQQCIKISTGLSALFASYDNGKRQPSLNTLLKALKQLIEEFPQT
ncbi:uncharacterized protein BDR25DRAFT_101097 [Lindgomyces ingoldianus]|uniref:Uncharacterized protein n=1 Tax=Lindgomyces ingoldianus TaxID=673940 RepID=A0ACB6R7T6_9PLEO|nr:uncharacterized protein BDR25DRAFT_101097 [Lindgomyces ingoldianus]KAF2475246.1 hypothetical protein BDR25DRAFT_101097 [Lindgomyces ingoldianus]